METTLELPLPHPPARAGQATSDRDTINMVAMTLAAAHGAWTPPIEHDFVAESQIDVNRVQNWRLHAMSVTYLKLAEAAFRALMGRVPKFSAAQDKSHLQEIKWQACVGTSFNPSFGGYTVGEYSTGDPSNGWCLYSPGAGGCWNQRTKQQLAPEPGMKPQRIDGRWYWMKIGA